jgi:hypothetical protein
MTTNLRKPINLAAAAIAVLGGLFVDVECPVDARLTSSAEARVGRPLTPMSYAGVARRTTRRAYYGAAAAGAAAAGAYAVTPGCAQVTDAYGRVYTRC